MSRKNLNRVIKDANTYGAVVDAIKATWDETQSLQDCMNNLDKLWQRDFEEIGEYDTDNQLDDFGVFYWVRESTFPSTLKCYSGELEFPPYDDFEALRVKLQLESGSTTTQYLTCRLMEQIRSKWILSATSPEKATIASYNAIARYSKPSLTKKNDGTLGLVRYVNEGWQWFKQNEKSPKWFIDNQVQSLLQNIGAWDLEVQNRVSIRSVK